MTAATAPRERWGPLALAVCAVLALACFSIASGTGHPNVPRSSPGAPPAPDFGAALAVASDSIGDQLLVWTDREGHLWYATEGRSEVGFSPPQMVPGAGTLASEPSAVIAESAGTSEVWVFWRGSDHQLLSLAGRLATTPSLSPSVAWSDSPSVVAGMEPVESQPAAAYVARGPSAGLWVLWKGDDQALESVRGRLGPRGVTWADRPTTVPRTGPVASQPTVGSDGAGTLFVCWRRLPGGTIVEDRRDPSGWSGTATDLGGVGRTRSTPSIAVAGSGEQYLFWEGTNSQLWYARSSGADWSGALPGSPGDGPLGSQPVATLVPEPGSSSVVEVYWIGQDLNIWTTSSPGSTSSWAAPSSIENGPF
ncbi:MAG TPA: hypothetical protein VMD59_18660 [Acidimicrobiales bacterium]|nr:hypothetical protein [Acidimicrobiales bacterium]